MGQHSPFSWVSLRNYVNTLSRGTIVCLIKISAPSTRSMDTTNSLKLESMSALSGRMNTLLDIRPTEQEEREQKWAEIAEIKKEMTDRTKLSGNYYTEKVTKAVLLEYIGLRMQINDQLIASYYYDDVISETNAAEMLMHEEENQELSVFLDEVLNSEEETNYYALWIYYWEELRGESAQTR